MKHTLSIMICCLSLSLADSANAFDAIPTLEDAGYAFEATEQCTDVALISTAPRRLKRSSRFRDGRRMFQSASKQWGPDWVCNTALQNLGPEVDLSDFYSGRRVVQPPPDQIPPLPVLKADVIENVIVEVTE